MDASYVAFTAADADLGDAPRSTKSHRGPATLAGVAVRDLAVHYGGPNQAPVRALDSVTMELGAGTLTAVMGPSGSGKTTLLMCLSGLETPTAGEVNVCGVDVSRLREPELTRWRRARLGTIFQSPNLLPYLTARENVELPLRWSGRSVPGDFSDGLLRRVGLHDRGNHLPSQLSGGQQQRVAIARGLAVRPDLITADEPTGALDRSSASEVLSLLRHLVDVEGRTVLMVTHDPVAAAYADRLLLLVDGRLVEDLPPRSAEVAAAALARHTTRPS